MSNLQIKVGGWRKFLDDANYLGYYNDTTVSLKFHLSDNTSFPSSWTDFGGWQKIPTKLLPKNPVISIGYNNTNLLVAIRNDGHVYRRSMTGSQVSSTFYALFTWTYQ